jgi:hypothetical protein
VRTRHIIIVALVAACGAAVAGLFAGRWVYSTRGSGATPSPTEVRADLAIAADRLNFGEVWESEQLSWTLPVENRESHPVEIESFSATCNCASIQPQKLFLAPGERRELQLQLDLVTKPPPNGEVGVRIRPKLKEETSGGKRLGPDWILSGRVKRVLSVDEVVYLGRHSELAQPLPPKVVRVAAIAPLSSLSAKSEIPEIEVSVLPPSLGTGNYSVTLTQRSRIPVGSVSGCLLLNPVGTSGEALPIRRVVVRLAIVSDLEAEPPAVQVGGRRNGEVFDDVVVLRSLTGRKLGSVRAEAEGEGLTVEATEVPGEFRVRQSVRGTGTRTNQVRFSAEVDGRKVTTVVPVTYTGIHRD